MAETDSTDEGEANARLISAAPDLLDALILMVRWQATFRDGSLTPECADEYATTLMRARAAIAKAEGR